MAKKKTNKNIDDLMAKLGASLKSSPIAAHQRNTAIPKEKSTKNTSSKTTAKQRPSNQDINTTTNTPNPENNNQQEYRRLQNIVKEQTKAKTSKPSYRGWKTSTVGLYPEDYQRAREAMNYIQEQTGENTNLSRIVKIALRAIEIGPSLIEINNEIKNKDGRLVSRRQNTAEE